MISARNFLPDLLLVKQESGPALSVIFDSGMALEVRVIYNNRVAHRLTLVHMPAIAYAVEKADLGSWS